MWSIFYTHHAQQDAKKLALSDLKPKAAELLDILKVDPYRSPPPFEKLDADMSGAFSRRINIHHRLVYQILEREHAVKVLRMWTHYE